MKKLPIAFACVALTAASLAAQAVGSLPEKSPFQDVPAGQRLGIEGGYLAMMKDPAGVALNGAPYLGLRWDMHAGGPAYLTSHLWGLSSSHDVLDYTKKAAFRRVGSTTSKVIGADIGLAISLTGDRTWHRWQPLLEGSLGFNSGLGEKKDVSGYSFGPHLYIGYGVGARYVTGGSSELRADIGWLAWQLKYPDTYRSTDGDPIAIVPTASLSPWTRNRVMTVSWTWGIFR